MSQGNARAQVPACQSLQEKPRFVVTRDFTDFQSFSRIMLDEAKTVLAIEVKKGMWKSEVDVFIVRG